MSEAERQAAFEQFLELRDNVKRQQWLRDRVDAMTVPDAMTFMGYLLGSTVAVLEAMARISAERDLISEALEDWRRGE